MEFTEQNLKKLQTLSKLIGILSFAVFIGLIIVGAWQLSEINNKISGKQDELDRKQDELNQKQETIKQLDADIAKKQTRLNEQGNTLKEVLKDTPQAIADKVLNKNEFIASTLPPRIYIHIGDASQSELADKLQKKLQTAGYIVPSIQNLAKLSLMPADTQLRYCEGKGQKEDWEAITKLLAGDGIKLVVRDPLTVSGCKNVTSPRSYELWLGAGSQPAGVEPKIKADVLPKVPVANPYSPKSN